MSQQSHQQPVNPAPVAQYRVSMIVEISEIGENVQQHYDLVVDMRELSPSSFHGRVNAVHYYIVGSSDDCDDVCDFNGVELCPFTGALRTMVKQFDDSCNGPGNFQHSH